MADLEFEAIQHLQNHLGIYHYKSLYTLFPFLEQAFLSDDNNDIKNCPHCLNFYGMAYRVGACVPQNLSKSFALIEAAANQGYAKAQLNLATSYEEGIGVKVDLQKAYEYCKAAADQGWEDAIYELPRITSKYRSQIDITNVEEHLR